MVPGLTLVDVNTFSAVSLERDRYITKPFFTSFSRLITVFVAMVSSITLSKRCNQVLVILKDFNSLTKKKEINKYIDDLLNKSNFRSMTHYRY